MTTTKQIQVSKNELDKVQYLTEVLPEIPTNTILYKKLTGLGATYEKSLQNVTRLSLSRMFLL